MAREAPIRAGRSRPGLPVGSTALAHQPNQADAYWRLAIILKDRLPEVEIQAMEVLLGRKDLPDNDRALLHFGLAGVFDAREKYEQAATHLGTANALQAAWKTACGLSRDADEHSQFIDQLIASFTPDFITRQRGWVNPDPRPVFVVGLPRSGTTWSSRSLPPTRESTARVSCSTSGAFLGPCPRSSVSLGSTRSKPWNCSVPSPQRRQPKSTSTA